VPTGAIRYFLNNLWACLPPTFQTIYLPKIRIFDNKKTVYPILYLELTIEKRKRPKKYLLLLPNVS